MNNQPELFPLTPNLELPDISSEISALTGGFDLPSMKTGQQRFLEKEEKKNARVKVEIESPTVLVLDIATPEGREEYQRVIQEIIPKSASDPSWKYSEITSPVLPDPKAAAGYRLIVTIRYWKQIETKVPGQHGFTIVPKGGVQS